MDDPLLVCCPQAVGQLRRPSESLSEVETLLRYEPIQRLALDQLHGQEVEVAAARRRPGYLDRVQCDDIGVAQSSDRARLALEALEPPGVAGERRRQHFQGHLPA